MSCDGCSLFDTPVGRCAIAWTALGIRALQLPGLTDAATLRRLDLRGPPVPVMAPPSEVANVIRQVVALLHGEAMDLRSVALDQAGIPPFHRRVYDITCNILAGQTRTYGEIAAELGEPGAARAVGHALGRNPHVILVPCHRVLAAGGRSGGFSAGEGVATKLELLLIERAQFGPEPGLF